MAGGGAAAAIGAVGSVLGGLTNAFSNQSRPGAGPGPAPRVDTSTAAIASARDPKLARKLLRNAREERLYALLTDPQVMGLITVLGGLAVSSRFPFHPDPGTNTKVQGLAAASCVLMGLGRANVGDLTTLSMAGLAGFTVGGGGSMIADLTEAKIPGTPIPLLPLVGGPPGQLMWALGQLANRGD